MSRESHCRLIVTGMLTALVIAALPSAVARPPVDDVPVVQVKAPDLAVVTAEDESRAAAGLAPRFAIPNPTLILPDTHGVWTAPNADTLVWRLRIASPGARSLNLGFGVYSMPEGGQMLIYAVDGSRVLRPFTSDDNELHGELWTPVVASDEIVVEVTLPAAAASQLGLELTSINVGYRDFGHLLEEDRAGACNVDVVCPDGDGWREEIQTVGVISTGGSTFCTGFMVNNTAQDETPFFMTADHCGIGSGNASSLVVYWNFQSPTCGAQCCGSLSQWQSGSFFRAEYSPSDMTLVELDDPANPAHQVSYAGWDRSTGDYPMAVAIHHPNTDEKSISFEYDATTTTSYLGTSSPGSGTHVRVIDWDTGTTEPGSSGSPLFNQNHQVVGQLHGGYAACGNDDSDWYGRFNVSWTGGGSNSTRLSNWLDPIGTGATTLNTLSPWAGGIMVSPTDDLDASGEPGGPYAPSSIVYTIENRGDDPLTYEVQYAESWIDVTNASGSLNAGATVDVTVLLNAQANYLPLGTHTATVDFVNLTDGRGDTARVVSLQVGGPSRVHNFPMDSNPGWSTQGLWAFGQPQGLGGQYGPPDPTSGYTGNNVYGYNLSGDYQNNLSQQHLVTTALDCSNAVDVSLKFRRWLGVETSTYDHASLSVSNNGSTWQTIWQNTSVVEDNNWVAQEFDISNVADNQATVYLRWTMGQTDSSWQYCGWNIDDVEIWGIVQTSPACHGDANCDGQIDFGDINAFVAAVIDGTYCDGTGEGADVDGNGTVDFADISPFAELLTTSTLPITCP